MSSPTDIARFRALSSDDQARLILRMEAVVTALNHQLKNPNKQPLEFHQAYQQLLQDTLVPWGLTGLVARIQNTLAEQHLISANWPNKDPNAAMEMAVPFHGTPRSQPGRSSREELATAVRLLGFTRDELSREYLKGRHLGTSSYTGPSQALKAMVGEIGWKLDMTNPRQTTDKEFASLVTRMEKFLNGLTLHERFGIREFCRIGDHRFTPRVWLDTFTRESNKGTLKTIAQTLLTPSAEEGLSVRPAEEALTLLSAPQKPARSR